MKNRISSYLVIAVLTVALITAAYLAFNRFVNESNNSVVELAIDSQDIPKLLVGRNIPLESVVYKLKDAGISTIAIQEENLERGQKEGSLVWAPGYQLIAEGGAAYSAFQGLLSEGNVYPGGIYIYPLGGNYSRILETLKIYFKEDQISTDGRMIELTAPFDEATRLGFGVNPELYSYYTSKGFYVIPRLRNATHFPANYIEKKMVLLNRSKSFSLVIFDEKEVLGFPDKIAQTADALKYNNLKYGLVEIIEQKGSAQLSSLMEDRVVRVHSIAEEELQTMKPEQAVERISRAVKERGIKVVYLRPFLNLEDYSQTLEYNLDYFSTVRKSLESRGFVIGQANSISMMRLNPWELILLTLGVAAGLILLLEAILEVDELTVFAIILGMGLLAVAARLIGVSLLWQKGMAFSAAVIFPTYAVISAFTKRSTFNGPTINNLLLLFGNVIMDAVIGIFLIIGLLADSRFLLGSELFSGIKVALLLPIVIVAVYFFLKEYAGKVWIGLKDILETNVPLVEVLLGAFLILLMVVAAARSGNFNFFIPSAEKHLRSLLETLLMVRPRTKEFLIGMPFLVVAANYYLQGKQKWLWLFLSVAMIGLVSLTNTFCHAHSPLMVSFMRSLNGIVLGLLVGFVYLAIYKLIKKLV